MLPSAAEPGLSGSPAVAACAFYKAAALSLGVRRREETLTSEEEEGGEERLKEGHVMKICESPGH